MATIAPPVVFPPMAIDNRILWSLHNSTQLIITLLLVWSTHLGRRIGPNYPRKLGYNDVIKIYWGLVVCFLLRVMLRIGTVARNESLPNIQCICSGRTGFTANSMRYWTGKGAVRYDIQRPVGMQNDWLDYAWRKPERLKHDFKPLQRCNGSFQTAWELSK